MRDQHLPITDQLPAIHRALESHRALVLQAEPGAGKSTVLPLSLLDADYLGGQTIIMLEPRRVAARSIAHYLAKQLGEKVGETIGYQVRNDRKHSRGTRLEIVTEGVLTRRLQHDPELAGIGLIIFDEFHERSLYADLALMLSVEVQQALRDDLKILVMSATLDADRVAAYLGDAAVINCPGRAHKVSVEHLPAPNKYDLPEAVAGIVRAALQTLDSGDLLVFLPGQGEIERCLNAVQLALPTMPVSNSADLRLLPLYGGLSLVEQERVLTRTNESARRVIFATNIAETSLTIDGITGVIDTGLERRVVYDPVSDMTRLETMRISKASATQRAGRAGRLSPGRCWRLWPVSVHQQLDEYQTEEVCAADLSSTLLELFAWGFSDVEKIPWLTPPPKAHVNVACQNLKRLGLIDDKQQLIGQAGQVSKLGVSPRIGAMLLHALSRVEVTAPDESPVMIVACLTAALLGDRDIFYGRHSSDLDQRLIALNDYQRDKKSALKLYPLHSGGAADALAIASNLYRRLSGSVLPTSSTESIALQQQLMGELLLYAFPDRLAKRRGQTRRYQLANGRVVTLPDEDSLASFEWLVVVDADGQKSDGRIFSAIALRESTVMAYVTPRLRHEDDIRLSADGGNLSRCRKAYYEALLVRASNPEPLASSDLIEYLPAIFKREGLVLLHWSEACDAWLMRVAWLSQYIADMPDFTKTSLLATVDTWLLPYVPKILRLADLKKLPTLSLLKAKLNYTQQLLVDAQAPEIFTAPSGKTVAIRYSTDTDPTVAIQLQELFGQLESPKLAGGEVPLRFELLSPARRAIQTTSDLAGFWTSSYFDVAKDMRGRYPKHRWPDEPLLERPGKSIKRR